MKKGTTVPCDLLAVRVRLMRAAAFTLVEVVASAAILGGVVAGLLVARGRALEIARAAQERLHCGRLCGAQVAALRAGLIGEGEGEFATSPGYIWRVMRISLPEQTPRHLAAYEVSVLPPSQREEDKFALTIWRFETTGATGGAP